MWAVGWTNRFLLVAQGVTSGFVLVTLGVAPVAAALTQTWPPLVVLPIIVLSVPMLWVVDAAWKIRRARRAG